MSIYSEKFLFYTLEDKAIKKIYVKRRKLLKGGHCVRCGYKLSETRMNCKWFPELNGELVAKGGIMKDKKCPNCDLDLMEFCFQDLYDEAKAKAKDIVKDAKSAPVKKSKKVSKKKSKNPDQDCLF